MRQRMRRPLRYGSSLKRGSLATTLNKMPGPASSVGSLATVRGGPAGQAHSSSLVSQQPPTTVNITWPPEEDGNGTGSFVLQVRLDGQQQQQQPPPQQVSSQSDESPPVLLEKLAVPYVPRGKS